MAFAYVQGTSTQEDASNTTIEVTLTGVTAGNLIVIWAKYEGDADNNATVTTVSDGTSSLTARGINHFNAGNDLHGVFAYLLSANSGTRTYTITLSEAVPFKWLHVREYSYDGTANFDVDNVTAEGAVATCTSGAITTTGDDEVVIGGVALYASATYTSPTIGGSAAGHTLGTPGTSAYSCDRILTAPMTSGTFVVTNSFGSISSCTSIISFSATGGGGGGGGDFVLVAN